MKQKSIREIADAWKEYKRPFVKQSTMAAYVLILENHVLPVFGDNNSLHEHEVQTFVLKKIEHGLSVKSVKDILIVLKMVMKFGVKNEWMNHYEWDIKYPANNQPKELEVLSVANHKGMDRWGEASCHERWAGGEPAVPAHACLGLQPDAEPVPPRRGRSSAPDSVVRVARAVPRAPLPAASWGFDRA